MAIRLVCLDAGFTLLSPRRTLAESMAGVLEARGHPVDEASVRRAWEVADRWFWGEYHRAGNQTWVDDAAIERTWRHYHSLMLAELGHADRAHELLDAIIASQYSADAWEAYPDVVPALSRLRAIAGLRIGVISDWGSNLVGILAGLGLDGYLDFVLASGVEGLAKPDPAFFRLALDRAGVPAADAMMVGDSRRADVEGARAAGMTGVLIVRDEGAADAHQPAGEALPPVPTISTLEQLPELVTGTIGPGGDHRQGAKGMP